MKSEGQTREDASLRIPQTDSYCAMVSKSDSRTSSRCSSSGFSISGEKIGSDDSAHVCHVFCAMNRDLDQEHCQNDVKGSHPVVFLYGISSLQSPPLFLSPSLFFSLSLSLHLFFSLPFSLFREKRSPFFARGRDPDQERCQDDVKGVTLSSSQRPRAVIP